MAIGTKSDFVMYHEQFHGGMFETIAQNVNVFNGVGRGAFSLFSDLHLGDYSQESFFDDISSGLIRRRDPTSTATSTPDALTQSQRVGVKVHSGVHVENTLDSFRKVGMSNEEASFILGQKVGKAYAADLINQGVIALNSAVQTQINITASVAETLETSDLTEGLAAYGDMGGNVVAWLMHSKPYYDLVGEQITNHAQYEIANGILMRGAAPATFGRPVLVVDNDNLIDTGAGPGAVDIYHTYGLTAGALRFRESEEQELLMERVGGRDNILWRFQWEAVDTLSVKGFAWDITNGGSAPNDTALGAAGNWDQVAADFKNTAAVRIVSQ